MFEESTDEDITLMKQIIYVSGFFFLIEFVTLYGSGLLGYLLLKPAHLKVIAFFGFFFLADLLTVLYLFRFPNLEKPRLFFAQIDIGKKLTLGFAAIVLLFYHLVVGYHLYQRLDPFDFKQSELLLIYEACLKKALPTDCRQLSVEKCVLQHTGYSEAYEGPRSINQLPLTVDKLTEKHRRYCKTELKLTS